MKQFEIYTVKLPYGSETETYIIILGNGVVNNVIFCAPIMFEKNDDDKNHFHIQVSTKKGKTGTIIAEYMNNLDIQRINGMVDVLTEDDYQHIKDKIATLYMPLNMEGD